MVSLLALLKTDDLLTLLKAPMEFFYQDIRVKELPFPGSATATSLLTVLTIRLSTRKLENLRSA